MSNPFPGMNPYLERHWADVHARLVTHICEAIQPQLPEDLVAQVEESLIVEKGEPQTWRPDVTIIREPETQYKVRAAATDPPEPAKPLVMRSDPETSRWIEIIDLDTGGRVVTAIELLSRSNKSGERSREKFLNRRQDYREAGANIVEIDLLRGGPRILMVSESRIPPDRRAPYYVCIFRPHRQEEREVFPLPLRQPLRDIPIPLRPTDQEVTLPLQKLIDHVFTMGRYDRKIDYQRPLEPALPPEDAKWADELLAAPKPA